MSPVPGYYTYGRVRVSVVRVFQISDVFSFLFYTLLLSLRLADSVGVERNKRNLGKSTHQICFLVLDGHDETVWKVCDRVSLKEHPTWPLFFCYFI